jgi:peptidoglycan/xylan/chitin deacetylase (PgdA/CDA1 family)
LYLTYSPFWLQWFYPTLTWHKNRQDKFIYLTFDDGPIPVVTPYVLNCLNAFQAKATFFCIGDNVRKYPEIYSQVLAAGHSVGNHTYSHLKGWQSNNETYLADIKKCGELVESRLFRPPYGRIKKKQIRDIATQLPEMEIIMWDVLSGDFDTTLNAEQITTNVLKNVKNGSIIVFHDSLKAFPRLEYALPAVLKELHASGYQFKLL